MASATRGGIEQLAELVRAADSVVAAKAALALQGNLARDQLHVIVHQCQESVEVAPVEGVNRSVK